MSKKSVAISGQFTMNEGWRSGLSKLASCPDLSDSGSFADASALMTDWTAPLNDSGMDVTCSITLLVTADGGGTAIATTDVTVEQQLLDTDLAITIALENEVMLSQFTGNSITLTLENLGTADAETI